MNTNELNKNKYCKVCHVIATNFYGGPEKQIIEHLTRLNNTTGFKGILVSFYEGNNHNEILHKAAERGIEHYGLFMSNPLDFKALYNLIRLVLKLKINIIVAHHYKAVIMGGITALICRKKILDYSRGFTPQNRKIAIWENIERYFIRMFSGIISVSNGQIEKLKRLGVSHKNMWVVHNSVELPTINKNEILNIRDKFDLDPNTLIALSVGRLSPEKGHQFLIEAISKIKDQLTNIKFIFCGDGINQKKLEKQALDLGISKYCIFAGSQKRMEIFYFNSDFLVLPSLTEGLPNVVLESFSYSKPVVATAVGGVPELVIDGENGFLVEMKRSDLLATAISNIIKDPSLRKKMGHNGFNKVKTEFDFDSQAEKLINIYNLVHAS